MTWIQRKRRGSASTAAPPATGGQPAEGSQPGPSDTTTTGDPATTDTASTQTGSLGTDTEPPVRDPRWPEDVWREIRTAWDNRTAARQRAAAAEERATAAERENATLQGQLTQLTNGRPDDVDTHLARIPALERDLTAAQAALRLERIDRSIERMAASADTAFVDPTVALMFLNREALQYDDDGRPSDASVAAELGRILTERPYLRAPDAETVTPPADNTPGLPNPNGRGMTEAADQAAREGTMRVLRRNRR